MYDNDSFHVYPFGITNAYYAINGYWLGTVFNDLRDKYHKKLTLVENVQVWAVDGNPSASTSECDPRTRGSKTKYTQVHVKLVFDANASVWRTSDDRTKRRVGLSLVSKALNRSPFGR